MDGPPYVRGLAIIRSRSVPIVDLAHLMGDPPAASPTRLVTVRVSDSRRVGLLVDEVLGLQDTRLMPSEALPPLLQDAASELVAQLGQLDERLLTILKTGALVPSHTWPEPAGLAEDCE